MPPNRDLASLFDIVQAARQIQRYAQGVEKAQLATDDEKQAAILYRIVVMGEATKRISQSFRQQHPEIPWREMAGMRDVITHEYDQVNLNVVWDVIHNKIPQLLSLLEPLIPS